MRLNSVENKENNQKLDVVSSYLERLSSEVLEELSNGFGGEEDAEF